MISREYKPKTRLELNSGDASVPYSNNVAARSALTLTNGSLLSSQRDSENAGMMMENSILAVTRLEFPFPVAAAVPAAEPVPVPSKED